MRIVKFVAGMLMGGLVGAGLALLFAPDSGAEMQRRLQVWMEEIQSAGEEAAEQKRLELTAQLEELKRGSPEG
jgi:gas vesicle protein